MQTEHVKLLLARTVKNFQATICIVNLSVSELEEQRYVLHNEELIFYNLLQHSNRKLSYLSGRLAAKKAVGVLTGATRLSSVVIGMGVFGYAVVRVPDVSGVQVCISHCENIALAIAFTEDHPMGIDIEQIDETKFDALSSIITPRETHLIKACRLEFLTGATMLWSAKESLSKILKTGFTTQPEIFEADSLTPLGQYYVCTFTNFTQYKAYIEIFGSYLYSIVLPLATEVELSNFSGVFSKVVKYST